MRGNGAMMTENKDSTQDELTIALKEMLKAIGKVYSEVSKIEPSKHFDLYESVQVCYDKFQLLDSVCSKVQKRKRTEWCKTHYCPDCPDSDTCSESSK
jgi:hypothetical protein